MIERFGSVWFDPDDVMAMEEYFDPFKTPDGVFQDHLDIYLSRNGVEKKIIIYDKAAIKEILEQFEE